MDLAPFSCDMRTWPHLSRLILSRGSECCGKSRHSRHEQNAVRTSAHSASPPAPSRDTDRMLRSSWQPSLGDDDGSLVDRSVGCFCKGAEQNGKKNEENGEKEIRLKKVKES